jgi:hypothetical protein
MYYPKSQIKTNLYTNGDEYALSTTKQPYKGHYHETSSGKKFTGKNPQDTPIIPLILLEQDPNGNPYGDFSPFSEDNVINTLLISPSIPLPQRSLPTSIPTLPTQQDKDLGVFSRYFCKKNNENLYIEIDKEQFTKLQNKDKTIAWDLYTPKQVLWQIKGDKTQTYNANKNNVSLIEQRDKWYGFTQYFKDRFLKYYLES